MKAIRIILPVCFLLCPGYFLFAQDAPCRVEMTQLQGKYSGDCKDGLAHGKGEAAGGEHYTGAFRKGLPHGKGTYIFRDSSFYTGNFQDGLKEGKGEMHYLRTPQEDSVVKGYWSGDVYRGSKYTTYTFNTTQLFDSYDISPMGENDHTLVVEITTTSGSPDGTVKHSMTSPTGTGLAMADLISLKGDFIRKKTSAASGRTASVTYEILNFPAKLLGTLSNGRTFELELYKAARWRVNLFVNE